MFFNQRLVSHASKVAAGACKRDNKARRNSIAHSSEDNRDFRGCVLCRLSGLRPTEHDNHFNVEGYELSSKLGKTLHPASRISSFNQQVTTLYPAPLIQASIKGGIERSRHGGPRGGLLASTPIRQDLARRLRASQRPLRNSAVS